MSVSPFEDLAEFFEVSPKRLPVKGKVYEFPASISGQAGLTLALVAEEFARVAEAKKRGEEIDFDNAVLDDQEEINLREELFGAAHQQMIADGLSADMISHVSKTLMVWHMQGEEAALAAWKSAGPAPKAKTPQDRKPKSRAGTSASGTSTKRRGSTTSTSR